MRLDIGQTAQQFAKKLSEFVGEKEHAKHSRPVAKQALSEILKVDYNSFSALLPYRFYDEQDQLFINTGSIGFGLELGVLAGADEKLITNVADIFKNKLPDDVEIQFVMWGNNHLGAAIDSMTDRLHDLGGMYAALGQAQNAYFKKAAIDGFKNNRKYPLTLRDYRVFCFVSKKTNYTKSIARDFINLRDTLSSEFKGASISFRHLKAEGLIELLHHWLMPDIENISPTKLKHNPHEEINHQVVDPTFELVHNEDDLEIEFVSKVREKTEKTTTAKVVSLSYRELPEEFALWMGADNICNVFRATRAITCPFLISVHAKMVPSVKAKTNAQRKYLSFDKKAKSTFAKYISGTTEAANEWKTLRDELNSDEIRLCKMYFNLVLFTTPDRCKDDQSTAINCYRDNGIELFNTRYMQLPSFMATLPFAFSEGAYDDMNLLGRLRTVTSWNLANMLPIVGDWKGVSSGLLMPTMRNQAAFIDPFGKDMPITNYNIAVAATAGAGKSFLVQALLLQILSSKGQCWVIDLGQSYRKFCELVGGTYLTASNLQLNPFTHVTDIKRSGEKIRDLLSIMASPAGELSGVQKAHLLDAVEDAWKKKKNKAKIDDVIAYLVKTEDEKDDVRIDDVVTLLKKYSTAGVEGKYFNDYSALGGDAKFVVLELGELEAKGDLLKAVLFALISDIEETMYHSDRTLRKMCVIDEAWRLLGDDNKVTADFIEKGYRTVRRHNGSFVAITQSCNDFQASTAARAAWNNSQLKLTLYQDAKAFDDFISEHPEYYSAYEQTLIKGFGPAKSEGFSSVMLNAGSVTSFHRLFVDPFSRILFSSAGEDFEAVKQRQKEGLSLEDAVMAVAKERFADEFQWGEENV